MKRFFVMLTVCLLAGFAFAQEVSETGGEEIDAIGTKIQEITIEDTYSEMHPRAKTVSLSIDYTPLTGEVRFYYKCMAASFDQGEAMNTAMAVFEKFALENQYRHYSYQEKDRTKYSKDGRGVRMATYESHVLFRR